MGKTMSKMRIQLSRVLAVLAVTAAITTALGQAIVYDNSDLANFTGEFKASVGSGPPAWDYTEFGDRIQLAPAGMSGWVTEFYFGYYAQMATVGGQKAALRLYANDGPVTAYSAGQNTPGSKLFDSAAIGQYVSLSAGWNTAHFQANSLLIPIPDSLTWTVEFTGLQSGDVAGLTMFGTGTVDVGSSGSDFWAKEGGVWGSYTIPGPPVKPVNFEARMVAIPEPGVLQLALLAGAGWLGWLIFRRRS